MEEGSELSPSAAPDEVVAAAIRFARHSLGPASALLLGGAGPQALVVNRVRGGARVEDAVLGVVHRFILEDRQLADEFLGHFLPDLHEAGRRALRPAMKRYLESGDLVQSVLGDLWPGIAGLAFETRRSFLSYLITRLDWKVSDKDRAMRAAKRPPHSGSHHDGLEDCADGGCDSPSELAIGREECARLVLFLSRLPKRDCALMRMHLGGASIEEIAAASRLSVETARRALNRAKSRLRDVSTRRR